VGVLAGEQKAKAKSRKAKQKARKQKNRKQESRKAEGLGTCVFLLAYVYL